MIFQLKRHYIGGIDDEGGAQSPRGPIEDYAVQESERTNSELT